MPDERPGAASTNRSVTRRMPAGLVDSAFSSLGTFAAGAYAARVLPDDTLGSYALFFAVFLLASCGPMALVAVPAEIESAAFETGARLAVLRRSLPLAFAVAVPSAAIVPLTMLVPSEVPVSTRAVLAVTAAAATITSPLQDHVRRMLHQAHVSWRAAWVSMVQAPLVALLIVLGAVSGLDHAWIPFGALALANVGSGLLGVHLVRVSLREPAPDVINLRHLARTGTWLVVSTAGALAAQAAAIALLTRTAGAAAAGQTEAARILAQPVTVVILGVLAVYNPAFTTSAKRGERSRVYSLLKQFAAVTLVVTVAWIVVAGPGWGWTYLRDMLPRSYELNGLLVLTIVAQAIGYADLSERNILLALDRARFASTVAIAAGILTVVVTGLAAGHLGPFALVWGWLAGSIVIHVTQLIGIARSLPRDGSSEYATEAVDDGLSGPVFALAADRTDG